MSEERHEADALRVRAEQSESLELGPGEQLSQLACIMGLLLPQVRLPSEIDGVIAAEPGSHTVEHAQPKGQGYERR